MKTLFSQTSINRFSFFPLSIAVLFTGTMFIWTIWHLLGWDEVQAIAAHQHSDWLVIEIISLFVIVMAAWLVVIRTFYTSQKTLLIEKAATKKAEEALQQSEARFRDLFENANDLIYTGDLQGNFTSLNKVGEIITGYSEEEFCRMNFSGIVAPEYLETANRNFTHKVTSSSPTSYELEIITKKGQHVALDLNNRIVYRAGEPIGVQGIGRDITNRWRAEKTLRESETRYRVVTESASDAIITIDHEQTILFVNSATEQIFGYTVDEMLGNKLFMLVPEHLRGAHAAGMKRYAETNKRNISWQGVQVPGLHKNGSEVPLEITFGEIKSEGKHLFTAVIRDITERKRVEEVLQTSEARYRMLFDSNPNPVLVFDLETLQILAVNKEATHQYGYSHEEFLEMTLKDIRPREDIPVMYEHLALCENGQEKLLHTVWHQKKDGTTIEVEVAAHPVTFAGRVARIVLITDITERRRVKEELKKNLSLLQSTFEATADGILVVDRNNMIVANNQRFIEMWQIPDEIINSRDNATIVDFVSEQLNNAADFVSATKYLTANPQGKRLDLLEFKDGKIYERYSHPQVLGGEVVGRVVSFRDITERHRVENQLRQSEASLAAAQRITHLGSWEIDLNDLRRFNNREVRWSDEVYRIFGYEPGQITASTSHFFDSIHPADRSDVRRAFLEAVCYRQHLNIEYRVILPNGSERIHHGQAEILIDEFSHKPRKFIGTVQDITERRRSEDKIRESGEWLQAVFDASRDGIVIENETAITYANKSFAQFFGYDKPKEVIGKNISAFLPPEEVERLSEYGLKRLRGEEAPSIYEFTGKGRDGTPMEAEGAVSTAIIGGRKFITTAVRDITERKRAEKDLQQSEEKYRTILETIEECYYEVDLSGNFTFFNNALLESLKFDEDEIKNLNFRQYVDRKTAKMLAGIYQKVFRSGQSVSNVEYEIIRQDGTRICAEASVALIYGEQKQPVGFRGVVRDITDRKKSEYKLRRSEAMLAAAQRITHLGSWELKLTSLEDASKNKVEWSDEVYRIFGYEPKQFELYGDVFYSFSHPDDRERISQALFEAIDNKTNLKIESRIIRADGKERLIQTQAEVIYDKKTDQPLKFVGTLQDITERQRANDALRESENKFRTLIESTSEGLLQVDNDDRTLFVNNRLCEMVGYSLDELMKASWVETLLDDAGRVLVTKVNERRLRGISDRYEVSLKTKSGEALWVIVSGAPIMDSEGVITGSLGVFSDITTRKRAEEQLLHDAFHDNLTGLANRALFMDHLRMTIERGKSRHSNPYAILFLDFDRFKVINDSLGHSEGDRLLNQIARLLESATRTGDLVARLGGDEFVILLSEMLLESDAVMIAERIQSSLEHPFNLSGSNVHVSASIGIALSNAGHTRAEDMLRDADIAMYRAKATGRACYQVFDQAMHLQATARLQIEIELRQALERGEFVLYYQPIINLKTNQLDGFEALVRWLHPRRGLVSPMEFIPAAEESNLILPLGRWILRESCRQLSEWQKKHPTAADLKVSVNLSGKQFLQSDLAEQVFSALTAADLAPKCLKLEITESYLMENSEKATEIMKRLRDIGVEISLDDFGTGYSSLSYLHRLPVDYLKIDRSFVSRMIDSKENSEIVYTIIKLAQNLKMKVIAEGIETPEQLEHLKSLHCEYGQGFYFSKPVEPTAAEKFIEENIEDVLFAFNQKDVGVEQLIPA